ncbi:MAG: esterase/lipase family protein [Rubrobacteraceae bacterium]
MSRARRLWFGALPGKWAVAAALGLALAVAVVVAWGSMASASAKDSTKSSSAAFLAEQGVPPPGANDPNCRPDAAHPEPIVLVPGTFESMDRNWVDLSPLLAAKGYCVYSLNYGFTTGGGYATGPIQDSAKELRTFVNNVLALTGAKKVSIVGHSQGGMMPRYYIKFLGGAKKVDDLVGLVPSNHGTSVTSGTTVQSSGGASTGPLTCTACDQQQAGSAFLRKLNKGDETPGKVSYTVVTTRNDDVVVPYTSAFLAGPARQVTNITIQDYYPADQFEHQGITYDPNAFTFVFDALAHEGPASP